MYEYHPPMSALWQIYDGIGTKADVVSVAWERENGNVYRYDFPIPQRLDPKAAKFVTHVVERVAKFALWAAGGWKLYLAGPDAIVKPIAKAYAKKGARKFDFDFFSGCRDPVGSVPARDDGLVGEGTGSVRGANGTAGR